MPPTQASEPLLPEDDAAEQQLYKRLATHKIRRRLSSMEMGGINAALEAVDEEGNRMRESEGLSQVSFFLGVLNVPMLCITFAWWPEHFWVLYCLECLLLIPAWFVTVHRVYRGALFILDFCWVVNSLFTLYMLCMMWGPWETEHCTRAFVTFFSISLGPLSWACIVLHNGLVFHSIEKTASLTIHLVPLFVAWSVVGFNERVQVAWPGRFPTVDQLQDVPLVEFYTRGLGAYLVWWVLHSLWLLTVGVDQPAKGRDTVFVGIYNKNKAGPKLTRLTGSSSIRVHAALYLIVHCLACMLAFLWPMLCFWSPAVHSIFGVLTFASAAWSGAGYYEYVMAHRYTKVVQHLLKEKEESRKAANHASS